MPIRYLGHASADYAGPKIHYTAMGDRDEDWNMPYAQVTYSPPSERIDPGRYNKHSGQLSMLTSSPAQITGAYAHDSMRGSIPTLLGMATDRHRRFVADSTSLPGHDTSLSDDSSAMVNKLKDRGVPIPNNAANPTAEANNELSEGEGRGRYTARSTGEATGPNVITMPHEAVLSGGRTVRNVLRGNRQPTINPTQFGAHQLQLNLGEKEE